MKQSIKERVHALRMTFHPNSIKAFIIPSTDPHLSEYVAPHWMSREWISGFTGSAGTAVILMDKAGLWTDSRYFLQATKELEGSGITLYKEMLPETPSIIEFLCQHLKPGESVSIDGKMFSVQQVEQMKEELAALGYPVYPSQANYVFFTGPADLYEKLEQKKILIRDCSNYTGLSEGYYRVAVKKHEENQQLVRALKEIDRTKVENVIL